jgi:DNA-binding CsgD family transcriptional regulator
MPEKQRKRQPNFTARQLKTFSEALLIMHAPQDLGSIPQATLDALELLLPGDSCAYNEFHGSRIVNISTPNQLDADTMAAFEAYIGEHPSMRYVLATNTPDGVRFSDLATLREWRATNLYNHVFRPTNLKYQVGAMFEIAPGSRAAFSINRSAVDFTAEQRDLMTLLRPHFAQAWKRANAISQRDAALALVAIAEVDPTGRILFATERASTLFAQYRSRASVSPRMLPEPWRGWLLRSLAAAEELAAFRPLILEEGGRRLTARIASIPGERRYQLHFEEKTLVTATQVAALLGLTPRQGEVLYWIAQGKSNEEIGIIIEAKVRTVAKHVEQIFARIGVENRSSATGLWHDCVAGLQR